MSKKKEFKPEFMPFIVLDSDGDVHDAPDMKEAKLSAEAIIFDETSDLDADDNVEISIPVYKLVGVVTAKRTTTTTYTAKK